ncbi:MAG: hypothetical protein M0R06_01675 [Sphaerochaeta sp.]|jgi:uncharacterized phiE125 gp8 family phage protein|nr:hypothetical protein [Sphaerochaeta sp.]
MRAILATAPVIEPISLDELKMQLRADSGSWDDNLTITQSLAYGSKAIQDNYTVHVGTGVDVLGKQAEVLLHCGTNGAGGTNDTKIQESDDNTTYTDWTGGAFTQVTTDGAGATEPDNADYKKPYTGTKQYIRTASKVLVAACEFGTSILLNEAETAEDDLLTDIIYTAREHIEDITRRALLTQTWDYYLDEFPSGDSFKLPFGNLQSVTHIKYTDSDGDQTTMTENTDYIVETNGDQCGRIVLPYGESWPSFTAYPSNPIVVRFVCGWTTAALVPYKIKSAMKLICGDLYANRESQSVGQAQIYFENKTTQRLLASARLWDEF